MTFLTLSKSLELQLQVVTDLDERTGKESAQHFQRRVKSFLSQQNQFPGVTYLCTHLDWLETAMFELPCDTDLSQDRYLSSWQPGHYMVFEFGDDLWHLETMETLSV